VGKAKPPTDDDRHKKVQEVIKPILMWFGLLQQYRVTIAFVDDLSEDKRAIHRPGGVASIDEDYPYRNIDIMFKRSWVDQADSEGIGEIAVHEILHVLLFSPVARYLKARGVSRDQAFADLEESLVELPAMWIWRMRMDAGDKAWDL
jgi:hypothetical protein